MTTTNGLDMVEAFTKAAEAKIAALTEDARFYEGKRDEARAEAGKLRAALAALTGTPATAEAKREPTARPAKKAKRQYRRVGSLVEVLTHAAQSDTITKSDVPGVGATTMATAAARGYLDVVRRDRPKTSRYIVSVYRISDKGRAWLVANAAMRGVA
jgi:hypothetical protein